MLNKTIPPKVDRVPLCKKDIPSGEATRIKQSPPDFFV